MSVIAVATYNMSFMSALGFKEEKSQFASEATFLAQQENIRDRGYWKKALKLLIKFIKENDSVEEKKTCVIGLQEIIGPKASTEYLKNTKSTIYDPDEPYDGSYVGINRDGNYVRSKPEQTPEQTPDETYTGIGSAEIDIKLAEINEYNTTNYIQVVDEVYDASAGWVGLSIIYDTNKFGDVKLKYMYDAKIYEKDSPYLKENENNYCLQQGRPLLIVVTDKNYVFVTAHGAQKPELISKTMLGNEDEIKTNYSKFNENTRKHKTYIQDRISDFLQNPPEEPSVNNESPETESPKTKPIIPSALYLMADLNDRFDKITDFIVKINITEETDKKIKISYNGKAPPSCCHNWDACCPVDRFGQIIPSCKFPELKDDNKLNPKEDSIIGANGFKVAMATLKEGEGLIENYRYRCDKVFGLKPSGVIKIFGKTNGISEESDHQMVYSLFDDIDIQSCIININNDDVVKCGNVSKLKKRFEVIGGSRKKSRRRGTKKVKKLRKHKTPRFSKRNKYGRKTRRGYY